MKEVHRDMIHSKAIFLDLDGTIIDHENNHIPKSTKRTIKALQDAGHTVVIATGRPPVLFYDIDTTLNIDTFIASNGRYVEHKGTVLHHDFIEKDVVKRFVSRMEKANIAVGFESNKRYAVTDPDDEMVKKINAHFHLKRPEKDPTFHEREDVLQMVMFTDDHDTAELKKAFPALDFNVSCPYGVDINAQGGMKEIGMKVVCDYLNIACEDTIAVGDGYNDITMVKQAGIGIAMGNACDALKRVADIVTLPASKDGIEAVFKQLKLI